jgi:hypothetical protein
MYNIEIKKINTKGIMNTVKKELEMCMNDLVLDMKNDATTKAYENPPQLSQRTGQLGNTMLAEVEWRGHILVGKVSVQVEYGLYLEHGSGIYADEHRGGARSKWLGKLPDGRIRWIKGQRPKHFMLRTYEEYQKQAHKYFKIG